MEEVDRPKTSETEEIKENSRLLSTLVIGDGAVQSILECPVCFKIPLGRIEECGSGHIICSQCRLKVLRCGLCRVTFDGRRSYIAEKIVAAATISCDFRDQGCGFSSKGDDMLKHNQLCDFRPIPCIFESTACGKDVQFKDYSSHLLSHQFKSRKNISGTFCSAIITFDNQVFFNLVKYSDGMYFFGLAILGSPKEAQKYKVRMSCVDTCNNPLFVTQLPVIPIRAVRTTEAAESCFRVHNMLFLASSCQVEIENEQKWQNTLRYHIEHAA